MIDRDKVIKGLEIVLNQVIMQHDNNVVYPSWFDDVIISVLSDAITLLKTQSQAEQVEQSPYVAPKAKEPRVMTLEEVKASKGADLFLEISGYIGEATYITATTLDGVGTGGVSFYNDVFDFATYNHSSFGWRCWTSRPTDAQREATPWEK